MYIDSHAHLDDPRFDQDREEIIEAIFANDIDYFVNIGADLASSRSSLDLARKYERIYAAVGIHPHDADSLDLEALESLEEMAQDEKVVAIGEIGLDYYYDNSPRELQKEAFISQIRLAKKLDLPIVIHSRDAAGDTMEIIRQEQDGSLRGLMHCYSYSVEQMREYQELGFYIALGGTVTFKNARLPKEVAREVDLDRLLIETDSPYLTPVPHRGKRNNPIYVAYVAEEIGRIRSMTKEEIAKISRENAKKFFGIE